MRRFVSIGVLIGMFWALAQPGLTQAARPRQSERLVLAFYYAWFDLTTWQRPLSDQPLTPYHSADAQTIAQHIGWARQAGIDALVQAWYGPDRANNQTEDNFRLLLDQSLQQGLHAAASVDMGSPAFLQTPESLVVALTALRDQHAQHAGYLRVGGRPVVFFWKQELFSVSAWEVIRSQVDPNHTMIWVAEGARPEYLEVFDGLYLYSVAWTSDPASVLVRWGGEVRKWEAANDAARYWVATAMPGYDDHVTGRADAFARPRNDGAFYRACWSGGNQSQADWVVITSFNEWLEGTHIEPSVNYGDAYLTLTAALAQQYRQGNPEPTATPEPPTATPEPPTPTATLELPTATPEPPTPTIAPPSPTLTPTLTLTPTATPFRLPTPTPKALPAAELSPTPSFPPQVDLPPAPTVHHIYGEVSPTPVHARPLPVEGTTPRSCALFPALLIGMVVWLQRRR